MCSETDLALDVTNRKEVSNVPSHEPTFRRATRADVPDIVRMLADDILGSKREQYTLPLPQRLFEKSSISGISSVQLWG